MLFVISQPLQSCTALQSGLIKNGTLIALNAGWETIMNNVAVEQQPHCCFSGFIPSGNSLSIPRKVICDYQDFFSYHPLDLSMVS